MNAFAEYLKQADIFYQFTSAQLEMVARLCTEASFEAGQLICAEGSRGDELYILIQGEVEIRLGAALVAPPGSPERDTVVARLGRGQSFGEVALVDQGVRSASVRATAASRVLVIPRDPLMMLCETQPLLGFRLMYNLAANLAMTVRNSDLRHRARMLNEARRAGA
jgi:CRP-like cAMP-binding protein